MLSIFPMARIEPYRRMAVAMRSPPVVQLNIFGHPPGVLLPNRDINETKLTQRGGIF
jgi:hypothetical protein